MNVMHNVMKNNHIELTNNFHEFLIMHYVIEKDDFVFLDHQSKKT